MELKKLHGIRIRYEEEISRTLHRFVFLNFEDEIFLRGRECNTQY